MSPLGLSPRFVRTWALAAAVLSFVFIGAALFGSNGVVRHEKLRDELERVRTLNDELRAEDRRLRLQSTALASNPEYIEAVIRDELGWVRRDEIVFLLPSTGAAPAVSAPPPRPVEPR